MTHPTSDNLDELLSAYFDGEVTVQERQLVEQALEGSSELQNRLAEYTEYREHLQSLPGLNAPPELCAAVLNGISRSAEATPLTTPTPSTQTHQPIPGNRLKWLTIAASVAVVGVFAVIGLQNVQQPATDMAIADNADFSPAAARTADLEMAPPPAPAAPREMLLTGTAATPQTESLNSNGLFSGNIEIQQRFSGERRPAAGELLSFLETSGEKPVLVTYSVVDVVDAIDQVQILLQKQGIRSLDGQKLNVSSEVISDNIVAIYMEAPSDQLDAALKQVNVVFESTDDQPKEQVHSRSDLPATTGAGGRGENAGLRKPDDQEPLTRSDPAPASEEASGGRQDKQEERPQQAESFQLVIPLDSTQQDFIEQQIPSESPAVRSGTSSAAKELLSPVDGAIPRKPFRKSAIIIIRKGPETPPR